MTPTLRLAVCLCVVTSVGITVGNAESQTTGESGDGPSKAKTKPAAAVAVWTQFEMNRKDAEVNCLWTTPENWTKGLPGSELCVEIGDVEFWGNKFKDAVNTKTNQRVGPGSAVLKLTGSGISTIHARQVNFVDAVVLDVNSLRVPAGTSSVTRC